MFITISKIQYGRNETVLSCSLSKVPVSAHAVLQYRRGESLVLRQQITIFCFSRDAGEKRRLGVGGQGGTRDLSDSKARPGQTGGRQSSHRTDDGPPSLTMPLRTRPSRDYTCYFC
jgi:hypothetical protein